MEDKDYGRSLSEIPDEHREMYHLLMPFKIREILLVSSLYDAFIIEEEGLISELVIGQYQHHLLSSPPRVTHVSSGKEALEKIESGRYDLVITMSKHIGLDPFDFGRKIKSKNPNLPVILLVTDAADINLIENRSDEEGIDRVFYWTGDPTLFLAIIKYVEDSVNVSSDTVNGNVRVLIIVEDSIRYYSMFLPIMYTQIVQQTRRSLSEDLNEMQRLLRRRMRPKILLAQTFEEGVELYERYKEYVLGVLADVEFKRGGRLDPNAGYDFIRYVRDKSRYVRVLMQSSDLKNKRKAEEIGAFFLYKKSPTLLKDFESFLLQELGFGDFIFRLPNKDFDPNKRSTEQTTVIAKTSNMKEFEETLQKIPLESILYHAERNDFSNWLMARGEFKLAMKLRLKNPKEFADLKEVRRYLITVFNESRREKQMGVITDFSKQNFEFDSSFSRIRGDSLGGKGRGIAFIRSLISRYSLENKYPGVRITVPSTVVIGTLEFDRFISDNNLGEYLNKNDLSDEEISKVFLKAKICKELKEDLRRLLRFFRSPLAVRSSSLLEDSQSKPVAGIYLTYMLPNNSPDDAVRLEQLCQAIKLIYASVFFKEARSYISSNLSEFEEEKMAIVIQELVGMEHGEYFYPTFSGVAQTLNFYPVKPQTFEDGIASIAVGLGNTIVNGEKCIRFSPRYPRHLPDFSTFEQILENSQKELYVLDMSKKTFTLSINEDVTLKKIDVRDMKEDASMSLIASTYNVEDGIIGDGYYENEPLLITFAGILKYNMFPLPDIIQDILYIGQMGMGCPIQIEFAVNIMEDEPSTFAVLQIRPLAQIYSEMEVTWDDSISKKDILILSNRSMGNGVFYLQDIVYVIPDLFDSTRTVEIAEEIGRINDSLSSPYLLIGPGRWGTRDRFLGIPVKWSQISEANIIVETSLEHFDVEPSQGAHFLHNVTSRGIGYIMVPYSIREGFVDWSWLNSQSPRISLKFVRHIHLEEPLVAKLDGRKGRAVILKPSFASEDKFI